MAEAFAFELKLVDSVSAGAKKAVESVKAVEKSANKANDALGKQFEKIGFAAARAAKKQHDAFAGSFAKIGLAAERAHRRAEAAAERAQQKHERLIEKAKEHSLLGGIKEGVGFAKLASAAFVGAALVEGAAKIGETMIEAAHAVVEVIEDGVKDAFKAAAREQTQRIGEKNSLGADGAKEFREDAERFAKQTPFNDNEIRRLMLPLRRAGLSQAASRQAFATATDIGGGNPEAVGGILEQFKHIYTKRGIGKKQLVELLGNVGTTIPDFYKELGKKMHISAKAAEKKSEEGGLDPQLLMNMITSAQNKRQGGAAGTGGLEYAKSLETRWKKINELPEEYYKRLVDSPGAMRASEFLGTLLEKLDPESPAGQRIQAAIEDMFEKITGYIGDPSETADRLASGIESAIRLTGELIDTARDLADAYLPSLKTIEDMTFALRILLATGDDNKVAKINNEYANVVEGRGRALRKKFDAENFNNSDVGKLYNTTGFNPILMAAQANDKGGGSVTHAPTVNVHVHGDHADPEDAGRKAGKAAAKEIERARQHGGG